jgi:hypothetical protein
MTTITQTRPGLALVGWKPMARNSLRGFADVKLPNGLTIHDVTVHTVNGKSWASLPSKPILGADGVAKRDDATGKVKYVPVIEWPDRQTSDRFSAAVVDAVEAQHPGAVRS